MPTFLLLACLIACSSSPPSRPPVVAFATPKPVLPTARPEAPLLDTPGILVEARRLEIEADDYVINPVSTTAEINELGHLTQVMKVNVGRLVLSPSPSPALFRRARQSVETLRAYLQSRKRPIE